MSSKASTMDRPYRVLLTRADNAGLRDALVAGGGVQVVEAPLVLLEPTGAPLPDVGDQDWVVFTSVHGVLHGHAVGRNAGGLAAVGPKTAAALTQVLRPPDVVPDQAHWRALATALAPHVGRRRVWLPRAEQVPGDLQDALRMLGADARGVPVYRNRCPADASERLAQALPVDAVVLASGSAARRYARLGGPAEGVAFVVIGPTTARVCERLSLPVAAVARPHTAEGLADAVLALSRRPGG